jgi:hypothetical protein
MFNLIFVNALLRLLAMLWASPYTFLGLGLGMIGICTGGRARIRGHVIEFYGGGVKWASVGLSHQPDCQSCAGWSMECTAYSPVTGFALDGCSDGTARVAPAW